MSDEKPLSESDEQVVAAARDKAFVLYKGEQVPHRSCGIAVAETFSLPTPAYQSLRRGGITGCGRCGAIRAGEQVLGELLGDPDPTGPVTDELRNAITWYQRAVDQRIDKGASPDLICNNLTQPLGAFRGPARHAFCTNLAAQVADITAEAVLRFSASGEPLAIAPIDTSATDPEKPT